MFNIQAISEEWKSGIIGKIKVIIFLSVIITIEVCYDLIEKFKNRIKNKSE